MRDNAQNPQHLRNLTLPFMIGITVILIALTQIGRTIAWWQVPLILLGMELWDLGWHSAVHHPSLWLARPFVRIAGPIIALAGCLLSLIR